MPLAAWLFIIIGALLVVGGAIVVFASFRRVRVVAESKSWPSTAGKIVSSVVRMVTRKVKFGDEPERDVLEHKVEVRYEYRVGSVMFSGIDLGEGASQSNSEEWAQSRAARFPVGASVPVYYSPKDPTRSVLEPGLKAFSFVPLAVGLVLILTGIGMIVILRTWTRP